MTGLIIGMSEERNPRSGPRSHGDGDEDGDESSDHPAPSFSGTFCSGHECETLLAQRTPEFFLGFLVTEKVREKMGS